MRDINTSIPVAGTLNLLLCLTVLDAIENIYAIYNFGYSFKTSKRITGSAFQLHKFVESFSRPTFVRATNNMKYVYKFIAEMRCANYCRNILNKQLLYIFKNIQIMQTVMHQNVRVNTFTYA